jgi:hypothetical protein
MSETCLSAVTDEVHRWSRIDELVKTLYSQHSDFRVLLKKTKLPKDEEPGILKMKTERMAKPLLRITDR